MKGQCKIQLSDLEVKIAAEIQKQSLEISFAIPLIRYLHFLKGATGK